MPPLKRSGGRGATKSSSSKQKSRKSNVLSNGDKPKSQATAFTEEQSYEQMKILTLCILSRISLMRGFFPKLSRSYLLRQYDPANPDATYEEFLESNISLSTADHINNWKVLPRGLDPGADKILAWLEQGISSAVELAYLKKFELTLHSVDNGPISYANMLESYTMSFTYGSEPLIEISSINRASSNETADTLELAKTEGYKFVEHFGDKFRTGMAGFDPLPSRCRMGMALLFNDVCPPGYQPPLFKAGDSETFKMLRVAHTDKELSMDTKFHEVSVGWSVGSPASLQGGPLPTLGQTSGLAMSFKETPGQCSRMEQSPHNHQLRQKSRFEERISSGLDETQTKNIKQLRGMQRHRSSMDTTQDTQPLHNNPLSHPNTYQIGLPTSQSIKGLLPYTQDINELIRKARRIAGLQSDSVQNALPGYNLFCGCDSLSTEESLIECEICDTHQHYPCYGYDAERPRTHVCYRCLFNERSYPNGPLQYPKEIVKLCVTRRTLYYIKNLGTPPRWVKRAKLGAYLGCSEQTTIMITRSLCLQNLLVVTPGPEGDSITSGEFLCSIAGVDLKSLFNPEKDINHLLDSGNDSMSVSQPQPGYGRRSSLHGPPSLRGSSSPDFRQVIRLTGSADDDSSTADEDVPSSPEKAPEQSIPLSRQINSSAQNPSQVKLLDRKRSLESFAEISENKRSRVGQTGRTTPVALNTE